MREKYDVVIIGAGPAGLSCAKKLQESKKSILLLEKNKEIGPKICAGGLTTKANMLNPSLVDDVAFSFSSVKMNIPGKSKKVSYHKPFVSTISRDKLGKVLASELIPERVELKTNCPVSEIKDDSVVVDGKEIKYKYLVGADGSGSMVRKHLGVKTKRVVIGLQYSVPQKFKELEFFLDSFSFGVGYAWIFPHENYTSIGVGGCKRGVPFSELRENLDRWMSEKGIEKDGAKLESAIVNYDYRGFSFGNKFLIGDAGGFASGLTGEGIYFAMASGREVARKIIDPSYECKGIKRILKIKKIHERLLAVALFLRRISPSFLGFFFRVSIKAFNSRYLTRQSLRVFS